jgi:ubiquinone/menaquinone biosynthesis C-methylase UbiE
MRTLPSDRTWRTYGKKAPYFGVFGQDDYLNENLNPETLGYYFSSGETYVDDLFSKIHDKIDPLFKPSNILDFGCGPGRMVIPFSRFANEVTGIDISQEILDEAQKNCREKNISNVRFLLSDDGLSRIWDEKFDLVHSFIVLQHLSVKRGEKLIRSLTDHIKPHGIGVIHLTYYDDYRHRRIVNFFRFRIPYLSRVIRLLRGHYGLKQIKNLPQMQMNNYDLNRVFSYLQNAGIKEVYSTFTDHHDYWGVVVYFKKEPVKCKL